MNYPTDDDIPLNKENEPNQREGNKEVKRNRLLVKNL